MKKFLSFTYIYDLDLISKNSDNIEFKDHKKRISGILSDYLIICYEHKRMDIILEYINYMQCPSVNLYSRYKLIKILYLCGNRDVLMEYVNNNNKLSEFVLYFCEVIENLEMKNFNTYLYNVDGNQPTTHTKEDIICELTKALCIRFVDDYYIKNEKNKNFQIVLPNYISKLNDTVYMSDTSAVGHKYSQHANNATTNTNINTTFSPNNKATFHKSGSKYLQNSIIRQI